MKSHHTMQLSATFQNDTVFYHTLPLQYQTHPLPLQSSSTGYPRAKARPTLKLLLARAASPATRIISRACTHCRTLLQSSAGAALSPGFTSWATISSPRYQCVTRMCPMQHNLYLLPRRVSCSFGIGRRVITSSDYDCIILMYPDADLQGETTRKFTGPRTQSRIVRAKLPRLSDAYLARAFLFPSTPEKKEKSQKSAGSETMSCSSVKNPSI
jgi:hypothetical protein